MEENAITYRNFELTISAMVYVADPPGSYATHPDEPVALSAALKHGLDTCGLGDRLEEVYAAMREFAQPAFAKAVVEFEEIRHKLAAGEE